MKPLRDFFSKALRSSTKALPLNLNPLPLSLSETLRNDKLTFELPLHLRENIDHKDLPFLLRVQKLEVPRNLSNDLTPKFPKPASEVITDKEDFRGTDLDMFFPTKYEDPVYLQWETLWCYRKLLRESLKFVDERARIFLIQEIQKGFRKSQKFPVTPDVKVKRAEARALAQRIAKANQYDLEALIGILEEVYGRCSKVKINLLKLYLPPLKVFSQKYAPELKNEIELHPMIHRLIKFHGLSLEPGNLNGVIHSKRRVFNLYRKTYKRVVLEKIFPPLPHHIVKELEARCDTQYHIYHAMHYPLDPNPMTGIVIGRDDKRFGLSSGEPAPPTFARLRNVARAYQKMMLTIPIQTSGTDYYSNCDAKDKSPIKFTYSRWAGNRAKAHVLDLDLVVPGEAHKYLKKHSLV